MDIIFKHCSVAGCKNNSDNSVRITNGMCNPHYLRWIRHGDPIAGRRLYGSALKFIQSHVNYSGDECLIWGFGTTKSGYGCLSFNKKRYVASRLMCIFAHGEPFNKDCDAAHSCGNRLCVNPKHLRWATRKENCSDCVIHGTSNRGERQGNSVLLESDVIKIKSLKGMFLQREIANMFNVSRMTINDIFNNRTWSWLK